MINHLLGLVRDNAKETTFNTDSVDKFNSRYCSIILLVLATFVMTNQLVGDVIDCWTDAQFSGQWVKYTDQMCWVSNTYHLPDDVSADIGRETDHMYEIKYYQWVPIILAMQSLLFFLPSLLWGAVADSSIDISNIVCALCDKGHVVDPTKRDGAVKNIALQFNRYIRNRREYSKTHFSQVRKKLRETNSFCLTCGSRYGNYLGLFYLLTKSGFVFNAWAQLFCLDSFLGPKFHAYGFDVLQSMYNGVDWTNSRRFPRVTLCDFNIRKMGQPQVPITVQCVLSINLFNERIFLFVWYMLMLMSILNTVNFAIWMWRIILRRNRYEYIRKHLTLMDRMKTTKNISLLGPFVDSYLQHDGVFIVRLMSKNANSLVISEMVAALFDNFVEQGGEAAIPKVSHSPNDEDYFASISPKNSVFKAGSRKGSLQGWGLRKASLPPSYNLSSQNRRHQYHNGIDRKLLEANSLEDLNDDAHSHSGGSSDQHHNVAPYPSAISQTDPTVTPEELAYIRRLIRQDKNNHSNGAPRPHHPTAPPPPPAINSVANVYTTAPNISTNNAYPSYSSQENGGIEFDVHPKAREAAAQSASSHV